MIGLVLVNWDREKLKGDIKNFPQVKQIDDSMSSIRDGVARMIMLERYAFKDVALDTLGVGDLAIVIVKNDPNYPIKGIGVVQEVRKNTVLVHLEEQYQASIPDEEEAKTGIVERSKSEVNKPLEVYYEQIADRVSRGLSEVEEDDNVRDAFQKELEFRLRDEQIVPAGRVLFGAGSGQDVTYFNCYVMPAMEDSREGISKHRSEAIEIMSRGGGVGTNGSSLRPRNSLAKGVNGKSSGSVSWLNDLAELTHLVEQGGSRRGAQMLMMADWHPDVLEFIISKMQNPDILRHIINTFDDEYLKDLAKDKLKFTPLKQNERETYEKIVKYDDLFSEETVKDAKRKLKDGGTYDVHNPDFLSGANISVTITDEFMEAVENDDKWTFKFPDVNNYNKQQMEEYNDKWHDYADYREWEELGHPIAEYGSIDAKEMWKLINVCATYSAEPGIFFIDRANADTNATAYEQKVIATNPCFTGDMKLLTDEGYKTFEELESIGKANIVNKDGEITKDAPIWSSGVKDIVQVRLSNNATIKSTPDHRYMNIYGEDVEAKDLVGERIMPFLDGHKNRTFDTDYIMMGFAQGDGVLTDLDKLKNHITINLGKKDDDMKNLMLENSKIVEQSSGRHYSWYGYNKQMKDLGFQAKTMISRGFPTTYKDWSLEEKRAFLIGLYSANGSVLSVGRVTFKSINLNLILEIQESLMTDFGIDSYYTTNKKTDVKFDNGTYTCKESYDLNVGKYDERVKFFNELGFIQSYKENKLKKSLIDKSPTVVSVKELDEKVKVYDFTESKTHYGVVEGYVVHNCGEQPLAPYSVCNLSAINLSQMVNKDTKEVDYDKLREAVRVNIRMQDNIIDSTPYFLEANTKQALGERRIGMGVMGLADMLIYTETVYGSESGNELVAKVFETMATTAYEHSIELAKEKGSFPFLIGATDEETQALREKFITAGFVKKLPQHIKDGILEHGIRNSHLLTVAPTGSTGSMINVSTGLEPYFAFKYYRSGRLGQFMEVNSPIVQEYLDSNPTADENNLPDFFVSAMDLSPEAHVDVQNTIQYWVDSSISKTVNAPKGYKVSQVQSVYERLFSGGAKGGTVYVDGSRDTQVLTLENDDEKEDVKPLVVDDRDELVRFVEEAKSEHNKTKGHTDDVVYGSEIGDTCPVCRMGVVEDIGGCNTCNNCQAQLKCGL